MLSIRSFHSSSLANGYYLINNVRYTLEEVLAVEPTSRTVDHWSICMDWNRQKRAQFVVIDPYDPRGLLYLNEAEYLSTAKVAASAKLPLLVVARPGDTPPTYHNDTGHDPSQNSPKDWEYILNSRMSRRSSANWRRFTQLRNSVARLLSRKIGTQTVILNPKTVQITLYYWARTLAHYAEVKHPDALVGYLKSFVDTIAKITKENGSARAILYLKVSLFALYSFMAGNPLSSTTPLGVGIRLSNGLPSSWDKGIRAYIRQDSLNYIRLMASLLNSYKALRAPYGEIDFSSITQEHPKLEGPLFEEYKHFCKEVFPLLVKRETGLDLSFKYESPKGLWIQSAGANVSAPALFSITRDARAWALRGPNFDYVAKWFSLHQDKELATFYALAKREMHQTEKSGDTYPTIAGSWGIYKVPKALDTYTNKFNGGGIDDETGMPEPVLGRLHAIEEAAGKIRIVAIADYFTQLCMKPVHEHLFRILRRLSTDATFDQSGRVEEYWKKGFAPHWSFDLKAATDTIPLGLYKECLRPFFACEGSEEDQAERLDLWCKILTDRDWLTPQGSGTVRYGTGQPMGALSSWASMALVHHSLVQFSAYKAGVTNWFQNYLVLGDDVDIAKLEQVALNYQDSCQQFSIKIGLAKSLQSKLNCFEFANRRFHPLGDISPLSLKEELSSQSWMSRLEYGKRILARFGTKLKDETSALVRKAATLTQWQVLSKEVLASGGSDLLPTFRFCLVNPFLAGKDTTIDTIINWISLIIPKDEKGAVHAMKSSGGKRRLELLLARAILALAKERLEEILQEYPEILLGRDPLSPKQAVLIPVDLLHSYPSRFMEREAQKFIADLSEVPDRNYSAAISNMYIRYCIVQQNDAILRQAKELAEEIRVLSEPLRVIEDEDLRSLYIAKYIKRFGTKPNFIGLTTDVWLRVFGLPAYICPDPNRAVCEWLKPQKEWVPGPNVTLVKGKDGKMRKDEVWKYDESVHAPIKALDPILAREYGIFLPNLPYRQLRKKSKDWMDFIRLVLKNGRSFRTFSLNWLLAFSGSYASDSHLVK